MKITRHADLSEISPTTDMKKILFLCDIDNTLIWSYKHKREGDVCVEILKEKEQGFTTPRTLELLKTVTALENVMTVPLTTRSVEQYTRIRFGDGAPENALVTNGTLLLGNEKLDDEWWYGSLQSVSPLKDEIERMFRMLEHQNTFIRVRIVDEMYLFVYCAEGVDPMSTAALLQGLTKLNVQCAGKKIYLFPPAADKGYAAKRMAERVGADLVIAAGDSEIDIPMLESADAAIVPHDERMTGKTYRRSEVCPDRKRFSEFVLETVLAIAKE